MLPILTDPHPALRTVCAPVEDFTAYIDTPDGEMRLEWLLDEMYTVMLRADGIGLAAPQVGVTKRLLVAHPDVVGRDHFYFVNPTLVARVGARTTTEGCLSMPGVSAAVRRAARVVVAAFDEHGVPFRVTLTGLGAVVVQHEMDHLRGFLMTDTPARS